MLQEGNLARIERNRQKRQMRTSRKSAAGRHNTGTWWRNAGLRPAIWLIAVLILLALTQLPSRMGSLDAALGRTAFDVEMRLLRDYFPREAANDPVLIGVDDGALVKFEEPSALWHKHYALLFEAIRRGKPAAVAVDIVLPPRSYDSIIPGLDLALLNSLRNLKQQAPLTIVHTIDADGRLAGINKIYLRMLQDETFSLDQVIEDPDRAARRFDERELPFGGRMPSMAGSVARALGKPVNAGYIDFSIGQKIDYIPMQKVLDLLAEDDAALQRYFGGKVVVVGSVMSGIDSWKLPLVLTSWGRQASFENFNQPGVVIHIQTLRSLLGDGLIRALPTWLVVLLCLLLVSTVCLQSRASLYLSAFVFAPLLIFGLSVTLITVNWLLPVVTLTLALWVGVVVRGVADSVQNLLEKNRFKTSFAGSVSPAVLQEMMAGNLSAGVSGETAEVCVLFSDIRGFTALSESLTPEMTTTVLTRYFDRMVACVHQYEGTIDKFIGDGMMVLFGAPRAAADPCGDAVKCAYDMTEALKKLNEEFAADGLPPLVIGIGINYGKVVVGNIGSTERHNYSAIGDAVNVASRLEGLTKRLKTPIVMTESVKSRLGAGFGLVSFGEQVLRGHSPLPVWGVETVPPAVQS